MKYEEKALPALLAGLLLIIAAAALALTSPASAAPAAPAATIQDAAQALRDDPVYVDPGARDQLSVADEKALENKITDADKPVFVAVLPDTPAFPEEGLLQTLRSDTGITGVYAIRLGDGFDAGADPQVMPTRAVENLTASVENPATAGNADAQLTAFVDRAVEQARGSAPASWSGGGAADGPGAPVSGLITLGALVAAGGAGAYAISRRNKRRKEEEERAALDKLRVVVDEDITAYGETLERLDFHPAEPGADDTMRADYERALDSYESAKSKMDRAGHPRTSGGHPVPGGRPLLPRGPGGPPHRRGDPGPPPAVLLRPASRPLGRRRALDPVRRHVPRGPGLRRGRGPAEPGRGPHEPYGRRRRRQPPPVLGSGPGLRPLGRRLLRRRPAPGLLVGTMLGSMLATPAYASEYGGGDFGGGEGGDWGGGDFSGSDFDSSGFGGGGFGDGGGFGGGGFDGGGF